MNYFSWPPKTPIRFFDRLFKTPIKFFGWRLERDIHPPTPQNIAPRRSRVDTLREYLLGIRRAARRKETHGDDLFKIPMPAPGVVPVGKRNHLAMDAQVQNAQRWAYDDAGGGWRDWYGPGFDRGPGASQGFLGYAILADLSRFPEFQRPASIIANEMTREWVRIFSKSQSDVAEKIKDIEDELERIEAREKFRRSFEIEAHMGKCQIYIDFGAKLNDLDKPLDIESNIGKGSLRALKIIEPIWTYPGRYDSTNPLDDHFYSPETWYVMGREVHDSRLLTIVSKPVPDILKPAYMFGGISLTEMLLTYANDWRKTKSSVADLISNFSTMVLKTSMGQVTQPGASEELAIRAETYSEGRDNLGLFICDKDSEEIVNIAVPLGSLDKLQAQAQEHQAAVALLPLIKMFGITPSGLNASSDAELRVLYDNIKSWQELTGTPNMARLLNIVQMSLFGEIDDDISFKWEPLWSLDEEKIANIDRMNCQSDCDYIDHGVLSPEDSRTALASKEDSRYASIDVSDMPDLLREEAEGLEPKGGHPQLQSAKYGELGIKAPEKDAGEEEESSE